MNLHDTHVTQVMSMTCSIGPDGDLLTHFLRNFTVPPQQKKKHPGEVTFSFHFPKFGLEEWRKLILAKT